MKKVANMLCASALLFGCFQSADAAETVERFTLPNPKEVESCTFYIGHETFETSDAGPLLEALQEVKVYEKSEYSDGMGPEPVLRFTFRIKEGERDLWISFYDGGYADFMLGGSYPLEETYSFHFDQEQMSEIMAKVLSQVKKASPVELLYGDKIRVFSPNGLCYTNQTCSESVPYDPTAIPKLVGRLTDIESLSDRYELYENGLRLYLNPPFSQESITLDYVLAEKDYLRFLESMRSAQHDSIQLSSRLLLGKEPVSNVQIRDGARSYEGATQTVNLLAENIRVRAGSAAMISKTIAPLDNARIITVNGEDGEICTIYYNRETMSVVSSRYGNAARYDLLNPEELDQYCASEGDYDPTKKPNPGTGKPVIYLYPEQEQVMNVQLDFKGAVTYTYPAYGANGWTVTAHPDGRLTDANGGEYYYLFWEGTASVPWECEKGACVAGADTEKYLRDTLSQMGLTPREYNDFITYWAPRMKENPYNLISFSETQYDEVARLTVTPQPDSVLRVHMVWKGLQQPIKVEAQQYAGFERKGLTVVEWGGTEIY